MNNFQKAIYFTVGAGVVARQLWAKHNMTSRSVQFAIASAIIFFELACDAYESGQIVRGWVESARAWWSNGGADWCAAEVKPTVDAAKAVTAWAFGVDRGWRQWSIAAVSQGVDEAIDGYSLAFGRADAFVQAYLLGD